LVAGVNGLLEHWDFGFVHQVLRFSRANNYDPVFLEVSEAASLVPKYKREYYRVLAREALLLRGPRSGDTTKRG
jgi:hypothetical protein